MTETLNYVRNVKEDDLQDLFNNWRKRKSKGRRWCHVGAPKWLRDAVPDPKACRRSRTTKMGYRFTPDVLWPDVHCRPDVGCLIELKYAAKYEPIGLPEVLHHAYLLANPELLEGKNECLKLHPVLISQQNQWTRATIVWLKDHGFRLSALTYLETVVLNYNKEHLLVFYEPFGKTVEGRPPPKVLEEIPQTNDFTWRKSKNSESYMGRKPKDSDISTGSVDPPDPEYRHLFVPEQEAWAAQLDGSRWLTWIGDDKQSKDEWRVVDIA